MYEILIRGMKMPENCLFCPCSFWDERNLALWCHALSTYDDNLVAENVTAVEAHCGKTSKAKRPDWCPLLELPPHGDLIDRRELLSTVMQVVTKFPTNNFAAIEHLDLVSALLRGATVVVPAERREE